MKKHLTLSNTTRAGCILALFTASIPLSGTPSASEDVLQVFLQGSSAPELASLVEAHGGRITHHLHIIDAVGAKVTGAQLAKIVDSPAVERFMDDLADSEVPGEPEEEEKPPCRVRGSIELDFLDSGISWRLYNKHPETATMASVNLDWPDTLGRITAISVGVENLPNSLFSNLESTAIDLAFKPDNGPMIDGMERLTITFDNPPSDASGWPAQRDFDLEAGFHGPCSTDLVPGYENNHEDYYYNTAGGVDELHKQGLTGEGVTVAVVDSGLWEHELLRNNTKGENRLLATYDAITDTEGGEALDESGHGTHMTSIIANSGKTLKNGVWTGTYKGVAPDANLVAVKILDRQGLAHMLDIVRGVQWVVDHREEYGIDVMNLSFSQQPQWPHTIDPVNQAVVQAWNFGIAVMAAAGNQGPSEHTIGAPANSPQILSVGAVTDSWTVKDQADDYIPDFSSRGPTRSGSVKPNFVALGGHMTGIIPPQSVLRVQKREDLLRSGEFVSTGTSQASAFATGVSALVIQLHPQINPTQLGCILSSTADPGISIDGLLAYGPNVQGMGRLNAKKAVVFSNLCLTHGRDTKKLYHGNWRSHLESSLAPEDWQSTISPAGKREIKTDLSLIWGAKDYIERQRESALKPGPLDWLWNLVYVQEQLYVSVLSNDNHRK